MKDTNRSNVLKAVSELFKEYMAFEDERHAQEIAHRIPAREVHALVERTKGRTLEDVADDLSVSRERARQLSASAKRRLAYWQKREWEAAPAPKFEPATALSVRIENADEDQAAREKEHRERVKELETKVNRLRRDLRTEQEKSLPEWRRANEAERKLKQAESGQWKRQYDELYAEYMERVGALRQEIAELKARQS